MSLKSPPRIFFSSKLVTTTKIIPLSHLYGSQSQSHFVYSQCGSVIILPANAVVVSRKVYVLSAVNMFSSRSLWYMYDFMGRVANLLSCKLVQGYFLVCRGHSLFLVCRGHSAPPVRGAQSATSCVCAAGARLRRQLQEQRRPVAASRRSAAALLKSYNVHLVVRDCS